MTEDLQTLRARHSGSGSGRVGQQTDLRRRNLGRVLREVHLDGPLPRAELAERLAIDSSTVRLIVRDLTRLGLVEESAPADKPSLGRPPRLVSARPDGPLVLALEVATDSLAAALFGLGGKPISKARQPRRARAEGGDSVAEALVALARPLLDVGGARDRVLAVGVSTPGSVRTADGYVGYAVNLGWSGVPLGELLSSRLALDVPVRVGNDAQMATLAEHLRGAGRCCSDFVCVWAEAGIGAGVIASGRQVVGSAGYGGRLGHIPISHEGRLCHCGSRNCLETVAGEDAVLRYSGMPMGEDSVAGMDAVLAAAEAGSSDVLAALGRVGHWLGLGLCTMVELFNPTRIALAGIYQRMYPYLRESIYAELAEPVMSPSRSLVEIVPATLGADSALIGAAEHAFAPFLGNPTLVGRSAWPAGHDAERAPGTLTPVAIPASATSTV